MPPRRHKEMEACSHHKFLSRGVDVFCCSWYPGLSFRHPLTADTFARCPGGSLKFSVLHASIACVLSSVRGGSRAGSHSPLFGRRFRAQRRRLLDAGDDPPSPAFDRDRAADRVLGGHPSWASVGRDRGISDGHGPAGEPACPAPEHSGGNLGVPGRNPTAGRHPLLLVPGSILLRLPAPRDGADDAGILSSQDMISCGRPRKRSNFLTLRSVRSSSPVVVAVAPGAPTFYFHD